MNVQKNILLKNYSSYKIGGPARLFSEVSLVEELGETLGLAESFAKARRDKIAILGGGTNILINDKGFDGLVIHNKIGGMVRNGDDLIIGSGVMIEDLLDFCIEKSLSGLEWAGGLPGTIGGAVRGNAGAFAGEIKDSVLEVESVDLKTASNAAYAFEQKKRSAKDCGFSYRNSVFKKGDGEEEFITSVTLKLCTGRKEEIELKTAAKIEYRKVKHPLNFPNIGSIFKNIPFESLPSKLKEEFGQYVKTDPFPVVPTAKIIFLSNLMAKRIGGAMVSEKHTNFIVNVGSATSDDVRRLIAIVKQVVKDKFGIELEEEIIYLKS